MKQLLLAATALFIFFSVDSQVVHPAKLGLRAQTNAAGSTTTTVTTTKSEVTANRGANTLNSLSGDNIKVNNNSGETATSRFTQAGSATLTYDNRVLVVFNDAGSNAAGAHFTGFAYSTDLGATFTDGGNLPNSANGDAGYMCLARNNVSGRIYLSSLGYNNANAVGVFRSDDHGVTWAQPINATPGGSSEDKPWITVDNYAGTGQGNVYLTSRRFGTGAGLYLFRSTDNGSTFGPAGGVSISGAASAQGGNVVVGPDHAVYVFWYETGFIKMRKSLDLGVSFGAPITVSTGLVGGVNGDLSLVGLRNGTAAPAPFRSNSFPQAVVNPVNGNNIYVTYANDGVGADKGDIFLVNSVDGGATWGSAIKVNDDVTTTDQWSPTIAILPDGSQLGVFYYSRQLDAANNTYRYYGRIALLTGGAVNFGQAIPISSVSSLPEFGRDAVLNSTFFNDYDQASASSAGFAVSWADSREDFTPGPPRKDPNIYFSFVTGEAFPPISGLLLDGTTLSGGDGDGKIDLNECNQLKISLKNLGFDPVTGITAVLSTSTPGVSVTQANSGYPDIESGVSALNITHFTFCTSTGLQCGRKIDFVLTVTSGSDVRAFEFSMATESIESAPLAFHNNTVTPIADNAFIELPINVSGFTGVIGEVSLSLHLTHTFVGDLQITLVSPDNTEVVLADNVGGSGDNFGSSCSARTTFDDDAPAIINTGVAPFIGSFRPQVSLSLFDGMSGSDVNGTWKLRIADQAALDVGTFNCATLTVVPLNCPGETAPTVTINQSAVQADPTSTGPIQFTVVFSEPVTGFDGADVNLSASTTTGTLIANVTGSGTSYNVSVSGMTSGGVVVASVNANAATNIGGQMNLVSTSIDNTVTYIAPPPLVVSINQAPGSQDPTFTGPIRFVVSFSTEVTGFDATDINLSASTAGGPLVATVLAPATPGNYTVEVTGMSSAGTVIATIGAGAATNSLGQSNTASTSFDNTVTFAIPPSPSVTINQASTQVDPAVVGPVNFTVIFSESVTGFTGADVVFTGSTTTGTLLATVSGSGTTYNVSVSGMMTNGTVVASIPAGVAESSFGKPNLASTSTDNSITMNFFNHDIRIIKLGPPVTQVGQPMLYSLIIENILPVPVMQNILVSDVLPAGVEFLSIAPTSTPGWILTTPTPGQNGTISGRYPFPISATTDLILNLVVRAAAGTTGTISNTATVVAPGLDLNPTNNSFTRNTQIVVPPTITCPANITVAATVIGCQGMVDLGALAFVTTGTPSPTISLTWRNGDNSLVTPTTVPVTPGTAQSTPFILGTTTITATATNGVNPDATCQFTITVVDEGDPIITCPANLTVNADAGVCTATLTNAAIGQATATDLCDANLTIGHSPFPPGNAFPVGTTQITWTATDDAGNSATCIQTIVVGDNQPPVITGLSPSTSVLAPPNHKMREVTINYNSTDNCGVVNCVLSVTSNEPVNGTGDGDTSPDWEIIDNHKVRLRAERSAQGNGRIYTITVTCTDGQGNVSSQSTEVRVAHNITHPVTGNPFKIGSTVNFNGVFWDKPGNTHTAKWLVDNSAVANGIVTSPTNTQNGKITGSYKFNSAGVYKLQMNVTDQLGNVTYANTNGELDAIIVVYDPNGGYAFGGGWFDSPAGSLRADPSAVGKASYGFAVNYRNAAKPKGETQFEFKVGSFEFNALNYDYLAVQGAKAQFRGTGKIIGGQSGIGFIMTVIDGALDGTGEDKIRMKIFNRNNGIVYYDNQPGASEADDPTLTVGANSTIFIQGNPVTPPVTSVSNENIAEGISELRLQAFPNPANRFFNVAVYSDDKNTPVMMQVYDQQGRVVETRQKLTIGSVIRVGELYRPGVYYIRIVQGNSHQEMKLIKLTD